MRQSGIVAAAGVYALDNCVERLADDHRRTKKIALGMIRRRKKLFNDDINNRNWCLTAIQQMDSDDVSVDLERVNTNILLIKLNNTEIKPIDLYNMLLKVY